MTSKQAGAARSAPKNFTQDEAEKRAEARRIQLQSGLLARRKSSPEEGPDEEYIKYALKHEKH